MASVEQHFILEA